MDVLALMTEFIAAARPTVRCGGRHSTQDNARYQWSWFVKQRPRHVAHVITPETTFVSFACLIVFGLAGT